MAEPYLYTAAEQHGPIKEVWAKATPATGSTWADLYAKVQSALQYHEVDIVSQQVFIPAGQQKDERQAFTDTFSSSDWPVTRVASWDAGLLGGTHIRAASGAEIQPVEAEGRVAGNILKDEAGQYCRLEGIIPSNTKQSPAEQAREVFEQIDKLLQQAGMSYDNVVRTWFYLDDILNWYEEFNTIRYDFQREKGLSEPLPASTAVGGANPDGSAIVAGALAFQPKDSGAKIQAIDSPLQGPATDDDSSFSRALLLKTTDYKKLWVSGTAAIDQQGRTIYEHDLSGQLNRIVQTVQSILEAQDMEWFNVTQATAYFKNAADVGIIRESQFKRVFQFMPLVVSSNTLCRDDLTFELELEAYCER